MIDSLRAQKIPFRIWVLCLTDTCKEILDSLKVPEIKSFRLSQLEEDERELLAVKANRNLSEYYFTVSPHWPNWLLNRNPELRSITYLDADLEFFSSPEILFEESKKYSIAIIEHRFHPSYDVSSLFGRFNVGWIYFQNDDESKKCLNQWKSQCLEWCKDKPEDGKFADQKYLDSWPRDFRKLLIHSHPGANLAPWNLKSHLLSFDQKVPTVDGQPAIFYHFQLLRRDEDDLFCPTLTAYKLQPELKSEVIAKLYVPYIKKVVSKERALTDMGYEVSAFQSTRERPSLKTEASSTEARIQSGELIRINDNN